MSNENMQVTFLNNDGGGFAGPVPIQSGMTISQFLDIHIDEFQPENYTIRVNREPVTADYVLQHGDRVSATPTKVDGGC